MVNHQEIRFVLVSLGENDYSFQITEKLGSLEVSNSDGSTTWQVTNKYFDAEVKLYSCNLEEFQKNLTSFSKLEAILLMFDNSKSDILEELKKLEEYFDKSEYPDLRMLWEVSNTILKEEHREEIFSWCLEHQFEYIENEDNPEDEDEDGGFQEKYGIERILEALKSHMWSNHVMKDEKHITGNEAKSSNNAEGPSVDLEEQLMQEGESFEELFGRLQAMKEKAQGLEGDARKDYAEKVAFAFMEALGIEESDDDGDR